MRRKEFSEEDTNPDISIRKSVFARMFPRIDCWAQNRKTVERLLKEADAQETVSQEWAKRGHWERAGFHLERASTFVFNAAHISRSAKDEKRRVELLRGAIVCYAAELQTDRYDPGIHWKIHRLAAQMDDKLRMLVHYKAAFEGFEQMVQNPSLDNSVRLGRLKRKIHQMISENDMLGALDASRAALQLASEARPGKVEEMRAWIMEKYREEHGNSEFYIKGIEEYVPGKGFNGKSGTDCQGNREMR